ncbi:unnamed protein product [Notodromas monacha]|nr:unnamed protein product [Notodromas monacha]CAG0914455.1 unnamed protein product [Notodromas monacha]
MGQIPALALPSGEILAESISIMEYLEETHPDKRLMPEDPIKRAKMRQICETITAGIQPLQNLRVINAFPENERAAWCKSVIERGFQALEKTLEETAGKFCIGDDVTLADCCLVPQVYNGRMRFGVDVNKFPNIFRIDAALAELPPFQQAHPDNQPDRP